MREYLLALEIQKHDEDRRAFVIGRTAPYNSRPCCGVEQSGSSSGS